MKRTYLLLGLAAFTLASFSKIDSDKKYIKKTTIKVQSNDGERLIAKSDCVGCHKLDKKLTGTDDITIEKIPATIGIFGGGFTTVASNVIDYLAISTTTNATDFGDLTVARTQLASCSSSTRGIWPSLS